MPPPITVSLRPENILKERDGLVHVLLPALVARLLPRFLGEARLERRALGERDQPELDGDDRVIRHERRPDAGAEADEQHPSALVAGEGLERGVVDDAHGPVEGALEVRVEPSPAQVQRLAHELPVLDEPGEADRDGVEVPVGGRRLHPRHHLVRRQGRAGGELPHLLPAAHHHLHVGAADVDHEDVHAGAELQPSYRLRKARGTRPECSQAADERSRARPTYRVTDSVYRGSAGG